MVVWAHDVDADLTVTFERELHYSIFDGSNWSAPEIFVHNISTKETFSLAYISSDNLVALAYTKLVSDPEYEPYEPDEHVTMEGTNVLAQDTRSDVFIQAFNISSGSWGEPQLLTKYSAYENSNTTNKKLSIANHNDMIVAMWINNGSTIMCKLWNGREFNMPIATITPPEGTIISSLAVSHSQLSGTTVATWTVSDENASGGYYYAVMESQSEIFGMPVFVAKTQSSSEYKSIDIFTSVALASNEENTYFLRLYTERDIFEVDNRTIPGESRIKFDSAALGAVLTPSHAMFDFDSFSIVTRVTMQNIGVLPLAEFTQAIAVYTGSILGRTANSSNLFYSKVGALNSGAFETFSFSWSILNSTFDGYVWIDVLADSGDIIKSEGIALSCAPTIYYVGVRANPLSPDTVILSATVANTFPYQSSGISVPIYALLEDYTLLNESVVVIDSRTSIVELELPAALITSSIQFTIGKEPRASFEVDINPEIDSVVSRYFDRPDINLVLNPNVEVVDSFHGTALLSVLVKNDGISPVYNASVGIFLESFDLLSSDDPLFSSSIAYADIPYVPSLGEVAVEVSLAAWEYTGKVSFLVLVNPFQTVQEKSYQDNVAYANVEIYPHYQLSVPSSSVSYNESSGVVSFNLQNSGEPVEKANISVFYYSPLAAEYDLLSTMEFLNVASGTCHSRTVDGLSAFFESKTTLLAQFVIVIPPFLSGSSLENVIAVDYSDAISRAPANCTAVNVSPLIKPVLNVSVFLGDKISILLDTFNVAPQYILTYGAVELPSFGHVANTSDNTAVLTIAPTNADTQILGSSISPGRYNLNLEVGLHDNGEFYSSTQFTVAVISPFVESASTVTTFGGRVTISGYNFGADASEIVAVYAQQGSNQLSCTNIVMELPHSSFSCLLAPGNGYRMPVVVQIRNATSTDSNTPLSFFHTLSLDARLSEQLHMVPRQELETNITISGAPTSISLLLETEGGCTAVPSLVDFSPSQTTNSFVLRASDAQEECTLRYVVVGENSEFVISPSASYITVSELLGPTDSTGTTGSATGLTDSTGPSTTGSTSLTDSTGSTGSTSSTTATSPTASTASAGSTGSTGSTATTATDYSSSVGPIEPTSSTGSTASSTGYTGSIDSTDSTDSTVSTVSTVSILSTVSIGSSGPFDPTDSTVSTTGISPVTSGDSGDSTISTTTGSSRIDEDSDRRTSPALIGGIVGGVVLAVIAVVAAVVLVKKQAEKRKNTNEGIALQEIPSN